VQDSHIASSSKNKQHESYEVSFEYYESEKNSKGCAKPRKSLAGSLQSMEESFDISSRSDATNSTNISRRMTKTGNN
jgi:hypothetical protein